MARSERPTPESEDPPEAKTTTGVLDTTSFDERDNRKEKMKTRFKQFARDLAGEADAAVASNQFRQWADLMAKFPTRSANNNFLIQVQKPEATKVLGYRQWQKRCNRHVMKGEKAIYIWAPIIKPKCPKCGKSDYYHRRGYVDCEHHERPGVSPDEWDDGVVGFQTVSVFDVSQTEGEPLPELDTDARTGDVADPAGLRDDLLDAGSDLGISVETVPREEYGPRGNGSTDVRTGDVRVVERAPAAMASTIVHEYAHAQIHVGQNEELDRKKAEVEAETVAYVVGSHFGLDMDASGMYVSVWREDDVDVIENRLNRIADTARKVVTAVDRE